VSEPTAPAGDPAESAEELYEEAPSGYLTTRPDGTIIRVNGTFLRWTGLSRDDLVGIRRFQDLLTPGGRIYHETHYAPLLQMQGAVREIALEIVCADGRRLPVLVNATLRRDDAGRPVSVRTVVFDATDRRRYEQELLAAREREHAARERLSLLARATRALVQVHGPADRARGLVDMLVPALGDWAAIEVEGNPGSAIAARAGAADPGVSFDRLIEVAVRGDGWDGVLQVGRFATRDAFEDEDRSLAADLAERTVLALDIALLLERQQAVALQLQMSLLTGDPPDCNGLTFARSYQPGVDWLEVGGDFYDAFLIAPGRVAVVVGDVVGRGLAAASAMGQLRSAVRGLALAGGSPSGVLDGLDRFVELASGCRLATVAYGLLDIASRRLEFACAGHPPPLVIPPGRPPELVWDGRSAPLGITWPDTPRPLGSVQLEPGSTLLLYTDGLIEVRRASIDSGLEELMDAADRARGLPAQQLVDSIVTDVLAHHSAHDDVCVLAVGLDGTPGHTAHRGGVGHRPRPGGEP
jgi:PAS domain S-box-containing protein